MPPPQRLLFLIVHKLVDAITEGNTSNAIPARKSLLEQIAIGQMDLRAELEDDAVGLRILITHLIESRTLAAVDESGGPWTVIFRIKQPEEEIVIEPDETVTNSPKLDKIVQECRKVGEDDLVFLDTMAKLVKGNQTLNVEDAHRLKYTLTDGSFAHLLITS